jgi:hypothetical protein
MTNIAVYNTSAARNLLSYQRGFHITLPDPEINGKQR